MKSSLALLLALFCLGSAFGQNEPRQDSIYIDKGIDQTVDFEPESRVYFEAYAENGRPSEIITTRPNTMREWGFHQRRLLTYAGDRLSQLRIQFWDQGKDMWRDFTERNLIYDEHERLAQLVLLQSAGANMPPENLRRRTYTYTASGAQESVTTQRWNDGEWQNVWRKVSTYNELDDPLNVQLQYWSDSDWVNKFQRVWAYDPGSGQNTEIITQKWSQENGQWENTQRRNLVYNNNGFWIGSVYQWWNKDQESWQNNSREIHLLNNRNTLDNFVFQIWQNGDWVNSSREVTYWEDLNFGSIIQRWDQTAGQWENWTRYQTALNDETLLGEVLEKQVWSRGLGEWLNDSDTRRMTYFWSAANTTDTRSVFYNDLDCVIPNPYHPGGAIRCNDRLPGDIYTLELYDLTGRRLSSQFFQNGAEIILPANLSRGAYLVQIRQDQRIRLVEKLLVVH